MIFFRCNNICDIDIFLWMLVNSEVKGWGKVREKHEQDLLRGYEEGIEMHMVLGGQYQVKIYGSHPKGKEFSLK